MRTILSIIMLLASVGGFILYIIPTYGEIKTVGQQKTEYLKVIQNARLLQDKRDQLLQKYNRFTLDDVERLERMLPTNPDNVKLILEIDALAQRQGITLQNVKIDQQDTANERGSRTTQNANPDIGKLSLQFTTTGPYPGYVQFIESLEKNLRLMNVQKSSFIAPDDKTSYQYQTTVETYWIK